MWTSKINPAPGKEAVAPEGQGGTLGVLKNKKAAFRSPLFQPKTENAKDLVLLRLRVRAFRVQIHRSQGKKRTTGQSCAVPKIPAQLIIVV